ncbi:MAG: hypothetical protein AB4062_15410 [Crocosphaera sp.]
MLNKLLGGGKKKEFFLELDEAQGVAAAKPEVKEEPAKPVPAPVTEVKEQPAEPVATQVTETPPAAVTEVVPEPETKKPSKKKSIKKTAKKEAPKTEIVPTTPALTTNQNPQKEESEEVGFATKFFMIPTPRRRPGPSLNTFRNMAAQVKVPRR